MNKMEKLIELLNEYLKKEDKSIYTFYWNQVFNCIHRWNGERCDKEWICSKSFGFIKWLVENDKINFNGLPNIFTSIYAEKRDDIYYEIKRNNYSVLTEQYGVNLTDRLLMLLSISDTPIEDLISYLK